MKSVTVVMSTFNGGNRIIRQLDSIFAQQGVYVRCYVRDDGSKDNTLELLEQYQKQSVYLKIEKGTNVGWQRSFLLALQSAPESDYYAFSDQDDLWLNNKLMKSVEELEKHDNSKALLFHCNRISCDANLKPLLHQAPKVSKPLSRENAVTQEYAQGCTIVINEEAKKLVCRHFPKAKMPHDFWTGLICFYFGEVYYCPEPLFYHINHGANASNAGHIRAGQLSRIKGLLSKKIYPNPASDLLDGYGDLIDDKNFLLKLRDYNKNITFRISLIFNSRFRRVNVEGTCLLKLALLLGRI